MPCTFDLISVHKFTINITKTRPNVQQKQSCATMNSICLTFKRFQSLCQLSLYDALASSIRMDAMIKQVVIAWFGCWKAYLGKRCSSAAKQPLNVGKVYHWAFCAIKPYSEEINTENQSWCQVPNAPCQKMHTCIHMQPHENICVRNSTHVNTLQYTHHISVIPSLS